MNTKTVFTITVEYDQTDGGEPGYGRFDSHWVKGKLMSSLSGAHISLTVTEHTHEENLKSNPRKEEKLKDER